MPKQKIIDIVASATTPLYSSDRRPNKEEILVTVN
jgi:hypothetical protein